MTQAPDRPSHFNQDINEYAPRNSTERDYVGDTVPDEPTGGPRFAPPPDPVPVYLSEPLPQDRTVRKQTFTNYLLTTVPTMIASDDRRRTRLVITNRDLDNLCVLTSAQMDNPSLGYRIGSASLELFSNSAVWAASDAGGNQQCIVEVLTEYTLDG